MTAGIHPDYDAAVAKCDSIGHLNRLAEQAGYPARKHGRCASEQALRDYCREMGQPFSRDRFAAHVPGGTDAFLTWLKGRCS